MNPSIISILRLHIKIIYPILSSKSVFELKGNNFGTKGKGKHFKGHNPNWKNFPHITKNNNNGNSRESHLRFFCCRRRRRHIPHNSFATINGTKTGAGEFDKFNLEYIFIFHSIH